MNRGTLIIVRHGESEWNARGVWTGTTDVHLTEKGMREAEQLGERMKDIKVDVAFVSEQVRTLETLQGMFKGMHEDHVPYRVSAAINERDYGVYTGKDKWEVQEEIGEEKFNDIRRGWDCEIPGGETLKKVYERSVPFYKSVILPLLNEGKNVLIVAHGNSIRSLVKYIENISDADISKVEMIFGTILIYEVDDEGKKLSVTERKIETVLPNA